MVTAKFAGLQAEYVNAVREAMQLDGVVKARASRDWGSNGGAGSWLGQAAMAYHCVAEPWVMRACGLGLAGASFLIVWSEATIGSGTHPDLSPFSHVCPKP